MPAKTDTRREIVLSVGERLAVITESNIQREVAAEVNVVLHAKGVEPLRQLVAADAEVDRLRVVLHVCKCQLPEWRSGGVSESECSEDRRAWLAAVPARPVMDHAAAETQVVPAQ